MISPTAKSAALVRYELPYPPSTNNLFVNTKNGRAKSGKYEAWRTEAGKMILQQGRKHIRGPVSISIGLVRPTDHHRDASNAIKPVEDLLVAMQVIEGDDWRFVKRVSAEWIASGAPCTVIIQEAQEVLAA